jgi:DNA-binding NarL/FixJ family response regulator
MEQKRIRLLIVEGERMMLDLLHDRLAREPAIDVVGAVTTPAEATTLLANIRTDVLLLDADLPQGSAFDMAQKGAGAGTRACALMLVRRMSNALIDQALRAGVEGVLSRQEPFVALVDGVHRVAQGQRVFSSEIESRLEAETAESPVKLRVDQPLKMLTNRQIEILRHLARGDSVKTVAGKLHISPKSVDNQKFRIMSKLGVRDKVSLALYAIREGLIEP